MTKSGFFTIIPF